MKNILATLTMYKAKKNQLEALEKEIESIKQEILSYMNGQETITCGQYTATNKECTRTDIDKKTLQAKYPTIADELKTVTKYNRFTVK